MGSLNMIQVVSTVSVYHKDIDLEYFQYFVIYVTEIALVGRKNTASHQTPLLLLTFWINIDVLIFLNIVQISF